LQYVDNILAGTIADGGMVVVNSSTPGHLQIGYMRFTPLSGAGNILILQFISLSRGNSLITITNFLFNTTPITSINNGKVTINEIITPISNEIIPSISTKTITIPDVNIISELEVEIPIYTSELKTENNIKEVSFNFSYSYGLLVYDRYIIENTLFSGSTVDITTSSPGILQIKIKSASTITGNGQIIKLRFKVLQNGTTPIQISDFKYGTTNVTNIEGVIKLTVDQLKYYAVKIRH
jgi:hypothetical protein